MKKWWILLIAAMTTMAGNVAAGENRTLEAYEPIIQQFEAGKVEAAMQACEQIAEQNQLAAATLYLIYSRGYFNVPIQYAKAGKYLDMPFASHSDFRAGELRLYANERMPPTATETSVTLKNWGGSYDQPRVIEERFPLRGSRPLTRYYLENLFDGQDLLCARVLWQLGEPARQGENDKLAWQARALELGSRTAQYTRGCNGLEAGATPKQMQEAFRLLCLAADAGCIPAMLDAVEAQQQRGFCFVLSPETAHRYLTEAVAACRAFQNDGDPDVEPVLKRAEELLKSFPDPNRSSEELLADWRRDPVNDRRREWTIRILAGRDDCPDCEYCRGCLLKKSDPKQARKLFFHAAENGSAEAANALMTYCGPGDPDFWRLLYWQERSGQSPANGGIPYLAAYLELQNQLGRMDAKEYRNALAFLAEVCPPAAGDYARMIAQEKAKRDGIRFTSSNPDAVQAEWTETDGQLMIEVKVKPSDRRNFVDFTFSDTAPEQIDLRLAAPGVKYEEAYAEVLLPDGQKFGMAVNDGRPLPRPKQIRILVEPTEKTFSIQVWL